MRAKYLLLVVLATGMVACSSAERERAGDKMDAAAKDMKSEAEKAGEKAENKMENAALTTAVKAKLAADVKLSTLTSINVDSEGSSVRLTGTVKTKAEKEMAETVAKSVDGVSRVSNLLTVQP